MRPLHIGWDFHGSLVNIQLLKQRFIWFVHQIWIEDPAIIKREIVVDRLHLLTHAQYNEARDEMYRDPRNILSADPYTDALDALHHHIQHQDRIVLITASGDAAFRSCMAWCEHQYLDSSVLEVYGSGQDGSKVELVRSLRLDGHVEDELKPLRQIRDAKLDTRCILLERPYQQRNMDMRGITVVKHHQHYEQVIAEMRRKIA